jgi:hypothetical protein
MVQAVAPLTMASLDAVDDDIGLDVFVAGVECREAAAPPSGDLKIFVQVEFCRRFPSLSNTSEGAFPEIILTDNLSGGSKSLIRKSGSGTWTRTRILSSKG